MEQGSLLPLHPENGAPAVESFSARSFRYVPDERDERLPEKDGSGCHWFVFLATSATAAELPNFVPLVKKAGPDRKSVV